MKRIAILLVLIGVFAAFAIGQTNRIYDTPVNIIDKPKAVWTDQQDCSTGTVTLRIEFLKSEEIGRIHLVVGLTKIKNESAIEAAKKIKFKPATKDRKPVTVTKQVQYSFSLY